MSTWLYPYDAFKKPTWFSGILLSNGKGQRVYRSVSGVFIILLYLFTAQTARAQCLRDFTDTQPATFNASGASGSYPVSDAFDNGDDAFSGWMENRNPSTGNEAWIRVRFTGAAQIVRGYSVTAIDDNNGNTNVAPAAWRFQGSTNNVTWTTIDIRSGIVFNYPGETRIFSVPNNTAYNYYRLFISETRQTNSNWVGIAEVQLFEQVCLTGKVFQDNGDRVGFNALNDIPLPGVRVSIVTSPLGNVTATTTTNATGTYSFSAAAVPAAGSFSVIMTPPVSKIFVTTPANLWRTSLSIPSVEETPPTGSVFFDYHKSLSTGRMAAINRMRYNGSSLDFGLANANPPTPFTCVSGPLPTNLITEGYGGTFGTVSYNWEQSHPHQKGFLYNNGILYNSMPASSTDYIYSNTPLIGGSRGILLAEQRYTVTGFLGTVAELADYPYTNSMLNNVAGGWRKSYGVTAADPYDRYLAVNGATSGSLPFFKQSGLTLTPGGDYTVAFFGKHANSYAQVSAGGVNDAQIVVEVLDNGNSIISSGSLSLSQPTGWVDDRPESDWQLRMFAFTAPGAGGPFTIQLRASTVSTYGNDFYIDNIVLYPCFLGVLPLQVIDFSAKADVYSNARLDWVIDDPSPAVAHIEYSADGKSFGSNIGATNIQSGKPDYSFVHTKPGPGIHYYRLKVIDEAGRAVYSPVKKVEIKAAGNSQVIIYPNPSTDYVYVQAKETVINASLVDISGKLIRASTTVNAGLLQFTTRELPAGSYYIKVVQKSGVSMHKIVVGR
jgi:hypothetical protein